MSAISKTLNYAYSHGASIEKLGDAESELALLLSDSKWCEDYRERLQDLRVVLDCSISELPERISAIRATVAQQAERHEREYAEWKDSLLLAGERIAALEAAVEQARELVAGALRRDIQGATQNPYYQKLISDWLAAHPAPVAQGE